jgi:hypothetical protein
MLRISPHDAAMIGEIVAGHGDWYSCHLIRLINKADLGNRELLRQVYPEHVEAYEKWYYSPHDTDRKVIS